MLKAVRTPEWKIIHSYATDGSIIQRELYDLRADPAETQNLYADREEPIAALEPELHAWTDADPLLAIQPGQEGEGEGEGVSAEMLKQLKALGYVD